jgi:hypothetical protein
VAPWGGDEVLNPDSGGAIPAASFGPESAVVQQGPGLAPVLSSAPAAPQSPMDPSGTASHNITTSVTTAGGSNSGPRVDWPSASLPAGILGLFLFGALVLLAVTEASPRTWQFRPFTPPA